MRDETEHSSKGPAVFSLRALERINHTYQARRATEREVTHWLETHPRARKPIEEARAYRRRPKHRAPGRDRGEG